MTDRDVLNAWRSCESWTRLLAWIANPVTRASSLEERRLCEALGVGPEDLYQHVHTVATVHGDDHACNLIRRYVPNPPGFEGGLRSRPAPASPWAPTASVSASGSASPSCSGSSA